MNATMSSGLMSRRRQSNSTAARSGTRQKNCSQSLTKRLLTKSSKKSTGLSKPNEMNPNQPLNKFRRGRQAQGRDTKIIITSRNSTTGTGKTTLAVWLALNWDRSWTAAEKGTLSVSEYLNTYKELEPGSVLVMDEAEQLDARRSMSQENVDFAEKWMMMRVRNVTSILTLPTSSALDKRLKELADVRINVHRRGRARVYKITVDDHNTSQVREWRWHDVSWPDLS